MREKKRLKRINETIKNTDEEVKIREPIVYTMDTVVDMQAIIQNSSSSYVKTTDSRVYFNHLDIKNMTKKRKKAERELSEANCEQIKKSLQVIKQHV